MHIFLEFTVACELWSSGYQQSKLKVEDSNAFRTYLSLFFSVETHFDCAKLQGYD